MKLNRISERIERLESHLKLYKVIQNLWTEGPAGRSLQEKLLKRPPIVGTLLKLLDEGAREVEIQKYLKAEFDFLLGECAGKNEIEAIAEMAVAFHKENG